MKDLNESLISNNFSASGQIKYKRKACSLRIADGNFSCINPQTDEPYFVLALCDIVGAFQKKSRNKGVAKNGAEGKILLEVYAYVIPSSCCCCSKQDRNRVKLERIFEFIDEVLCVNWLNAINCSIRNITISTFVDSSIIGPPPSRNFVVFVNPVGGPGNAVRIWNNDVKPMLEQAGINYELLITERADHAKDVVQSRDLSCIHGIVVVGGDGLIFEVVNGLSLRQDAAQIMTSMPLIPIPGGSGNGLAKSLLFECGEEYSTTNAAFVGVKGQSSSLDISIVNTTSAKHLSFLIMGWGFVSDSDILSNSLRWMGETRFFVAGAYNIFRRKSYRGRLSILTNHQGLAKCETHLLGDLDMPPLDQPLNPESWEVIEDDFLLVWVVQTSHSSSSIYSGPNVVMDDGMFTIMVVRASTSVCSMIDMMTKLDYGEHFDNKDCEVFKTKAYRLEPLTNEGLYTLDGEEIEYGPIQGVIEAQALRVMKTRR